MPDWSEGSVFVLLGIASDDASLILDGLKMIHEENHALAPALVIVLNRKLKKAGGIQPYETEDEAQVLKWIPSWISMLEDEAANSRAVDAFLTEIYKDYN